MKSQTTKLDRNDAARSVDVNATQIGAHHCNDRRQAFDRTFMCADLFVNILIKNTIITDVHSTAERERGLISKHVYY